MSGEEIELAEILGQDFVVAELLYLMNYPADWVPAERLAKKFIYTKAELMAGLFVVYSQEHAEVTATLYLAAEHIWRYYHDVQITGQREQLILEEKIRGTRKAISKVLAATGQTERERVKNHRTRAKELRACSDGGSDGAAVPPAE